MYNRATHFFLRLFSEILKESPDASEIEFLEDGSWRSKDKKDNESSSGNHTVHAIGLGRSKIKNLQGF